MMPLEKKTNTTSPFHNELRTKHNKHSKQGYHIHPTARNLPYLHDECNNDPKQSRTFETEWIQKTNDQNSHLTDLKDCNETLNK